MGTTRTADEVKEDLIQQMGPDFGAFWYAFQNDLFLLHLKWQQFRELYGTSNERIELLNATAGLFFALLQDVLWDDTLLHITRLTERWKRRNKVLTVQRIPALVPARIKAETAKLVTAAVDSAAFARDWRDNRAAHRSLKHALGRHSRPLKGGSRSDVENALSALRAVFHCVEGHYLNAETLFTVRGAGGAGAETLLWKLARAHEDAETRERRVREGKPLPGD